jgi:hypothetical protein
MQVTNPFPDHDKMLAATALFLMEAAMPDFRFTLIVMTSLSTALLASCGTGGYSRGDSYDVRDRDWYESRQDEIGCMGEAQRSGLFPGPGYDSYVANCANDREEARD